MFPPQPSKKPPEHRTSQGEVSRREKREGSHVKSKRSLPRAFDRANERLVSGRKLWISGRYKVFPLNFADDSVRVNAGLRADGSRCLQGDILLSLERVASVIARRIAVYWCWCLWWWCAEFPAANVGLLLPARVLPGRLRPSVYFDAIDRGLPAQQENASVMEVLGRCCVVVVAAVAAAAAAAAAAVAPKLTSAAIEVAAAMLLVMVLLQLSLSLLLLLLLLLLLC